ncbi:hypothetical protein TSOC_004646 [Tetrabaena socialis]|uniref:Uncharacterized protein n=1 Tax=Tetrabaena socialis TaxID=47790 RepID=A0A2J8A8C2_9CHLO|nr:hypothetical protein TSOC_004646 [Tetrabaena socialis]|eukprot:PNH08761.1 hypothetical protein TSOC_004646 [Tetrabaena socialis]
MWPSFDNDDDDQDERSLKEATTALEQFLKLRGLWPCDCPLNLLNANVTESQGIISLCYQLANLQEHDVRAREQLRDQADKDRVALGLAHKKTDRLEEANRRLIAQCKEVQAQHMAEKHKWQEQERELRRSLKSTTDRLNGFLPGGRSCAAGRRVGPTPAYDRYRDDPTEAAVAEAVRDLEDKVAKLRKDNARLKEQAAAAAPRQSGGGAGRVLRRDRRPQPSRSEETETDLNVSSDDRSSGVRADSDLQAVRNALSEEARRDRDAAGARAAAGQEPPPFDAETARLRRLVTDLRMNVEQLHHSKQELQRLADKGAAERAELHNTLHKLRSKCASLETERRNAEDRFLRAQRANAALLDPAAAEAQAGELRAKLAAAEKGLQEANGSVAELQRRLAGSEADGAANQRHLEVLKRALRTLPRGPAALEQLQALVAEELAPLRESLREAKEELEEARAECARARAETPSGAAAADEAYRQACSHLPLTPAGPMPPSPSGVFDGFQPSTLPSKDSPPLLHPPPAHAFFNRAFSATMPTLHGDRSRPASPPRERTDGSCGGAPLLQPARLHPGASPSASISELGPVCEASPPAVGGAMWRRSLSAGVPQRSGGVGVSAERRRWELPAAHVHKRYPSPADVLIQQASGALLADDISISLTLGTGRDERG